MILLISRCASTAFCASKERYWRRRTSRLRFDLVSNLSKHGIRCVLLIAFAEISVFNVGCAVFLLSQNKSNYHQVDPVDDGVFEADILLTEKQSDILLNDLGKV